MVASSSVGRGVGKGRLERKPKEWEGQKRRKERKREGSAGGPTGRNPAPELKEQEESQGFDPSLQESRGRRHRRWRTERRKKDPEVQQKKEEKEKSGQSARDGKG